MRVYGYSQDVGTPERCRTVTGVVAYDHPETGDVYMLVIHQAILVPNMTVNLISHMQVRNNGVRLNDEPKHMVQRLMDLHHAINIDGSEETEALRIPLMINGVISYFPTRKPTRREWLDMEPGKRHRHRLTRKRTRQPTQRRARQ